MIERCFLRECGWAALAAGLMLLGAPALGWQPDYGFDWVRVGAAGNRATIASEVPDYPSLQLGAVDREYRIMRGEVSNSQYIEFLTAYQPHHPGVPWTSALTGSGIGWTGSGYAVAPGWENVGITTSFATLAFFANWLHNDKRSDLAAFRTGAYDTTEWFFDESLNAFTFTPDQFKRSADARVWIPSHDEWVKAVYYDPDRYGIGEGGYWQHPNGTNDPLDETETSGAMGWADGHPPELGLFPDTQSPWGLIDASGGQREWVENITSGGAVIRGSLWGDPDYSYDDRIEWMSTRNRNSNVGFRLAAAVPAPGGVCGVGAGGPASSAAGWVWVVVRLY